MQLYTKILLGMVAGVVLGLLLGPKSVVLPADTLVIPDASEFVFVAANNKNQEYPSNDAAPVTMPSMPMHLKLLEKVSGENPWVMVSFEYETKLRGWDQNHGQLIQKASGIASVGETGRLWLKRKPIAATGTFAPQPVSGFGLGFLTALKPIGQIFLRLIKMVIIPLVFSSLLVGVASLGDIRKLGRLGGRTLLTYFVTTAVAISIGLIFAGVFRPGNFMGEAERTSLNAQFAGDATVKVQRASQSPDLMDNILSIIPTNPIQALGEGDMLAVIFFALMLGIALTMMKPQDAEPVVTFFDRVQQAMVILIHMVMLVAPFGVAALLADVVGKTGLSVLMALMAYAGVVVIALAAHAFLVYGSILRAWARLPFLDFLRAIRPAQLIAFSTSSSSATLPVSMECAEQNIGVSNSVASFVLPLGATVNMDGTALYQGVAAVFIAQVFGIDLSFADQVGIVLTATAASIGAAGVPGAGMITLALVLTNANIPTAGVALILGMDRILDMFRTVVNITGDLSVTAAMAALEGEKLSVLSPEEDQADPKRGFERPMIPGQQSVLPESPQ